MVDVTQDQARRHATLARIAKREIEYDRLRRVRLGEIGLGPRVLADAAPDPGEGKEKAMLQAITLDAGFVREIARLGQYEAAFNGVLAALANADSHEECTLRVWRVVAAQLVAAGETPDPASCPLLFRLPGGAA